VSPNPARRYRRCRARRSALVSTRQSLFALSCIASRIHPPPPHTLSPAPLLVPALPLVIIIDLCESGRSATKKRDETIRIAPR
jgi:hypothetical protein